MNNNNDTKNTINDEKRMITKEEYEYLKCREEELESIENFIQLSNSFSLKIFQGAVHPMNHPNYLDNRVRIEINNLDDYKIQIEKRNYILNDSIYEIIKNIIEEDLNNLINLARQEEKGQLLEFGGGSTIILKFNSLFIYFNGQGSENTVASSCKHIFTKNFIRE